jgi:glutathione S-transferase
VLDQHLATRDYAVGNAITIADYSLIHLEGFKEAVPFDWSPYPNLNAYYERMRTVPHWARTAPPSREAIGRRPQPAPRTLAASPL